MDTETMRFFIREAAGLPDVSIGFTGGEALLLYEEILEMALYAHSLGVPFSLNTNGFWGCDGKVWRARIQKLKEAGLSFIYFSTDRWHQEFVPLADLKEAIRICRELEIGAQMIIVETADSDDLAYVKQELLPEMEWLDIVTTPALAVGRGCDCLSAESLLKTVKAEDACCCFENILQIGNDGYVYMCCSPCAREIPLLKLGKAGEDSLHRLIRKIMETDALYILLKEGLGWFYREAVSIGKNPQPLAASPCQVCLELLGDSGFLNTISGQIKEKADALRMQKFFAQISEWRKE